MKNDLFDEYVYKSKKYKKKYRDLMDELYCDDENIDSGCEISSQSLDELVNCSEVR